MTLSPNAKTSLLRARAVFMGLLVVIILSSAVDAVMHGTGIFPAMGQAMSTELWWLAICYRFVFTLFGGWLAGRLDPERSMRAPWILTGIGTVLGLLGVAAAVGKPEMGPAWYAWAIAVTGPPASWLGGTLYTSNHKA